MRLELLRCIGSGVDLVERKRVRERREDVRWKDRRDRERDG